MNILHIGHSWGGGLTKWIKSFPQIHGGKNLFLTFEPDGKSFSLLDLVTGRSSFAFELERAIKESELSHDEYRRHLERTITKNEISIVIVSSLIGHSLDALKLEVPTAYIFHDYFGYCPHINITYKETCTSCDSRRLKDCFKNNSLERIFRRDPGHWLEYRREFIELLVNKEILLIAPDKSVANNLRVLEPILSEVNIECIPHGIHQEKDNKFEKVLAGEKLRILFPFGSLDHKGADIFVKLAEKYHQKATFYCYGYNSTHSKKIESLCSQGIIAKNFGPFKETELEGILNEISPHLAILPCKVPETFSYTLSEMINFCIPLIATNIGSFKNRVIPEIGFLVDPTLEAFDNSIQKILEDPSCLYGMSKAQERIPTQTMETFALGYLKAIGAYLDRWKAV